ncbi:MAG: type I-E CRISPR-associated protein Cas5/CasD [Chloroflexota bacterium]|nr:type I-E CRISPR-associated protein Cas5/CasD [Chloroflexota bacterium]
MTTLLIRLQAPMQSWGISSHFTNRDTGREPSKSGVIGLICAALGRPRSADLSDLNNLRMGVRVDREGILQKDFHIAQDIFLAAGKGTKDSEISDRYYLADAAFLVAFEGSQELLKEIHQALKSPHWSLYLGRKAFPPGKPVWLKNGILDEPLLEALKQFPSIVKDETQDVRLIIESENGEFVRTDIPINFKDRKFSSRRVHITRVERPPYEEV